MNKADDIYCTVLMEGAADAEAVHVDATVADLWAVIACFEEAESSYRLSEVEELTEKLLATGFVRCDRSEWVRDENHREGGFERIVFDGTRPLTYTEAREMAEKAITERNALRPKKEKKA